MFINKVNLLTEGKTAPLFWSALQNEKYGGIHELLFLNFITKTFVIQRKKEYPNWKDSWLF